MTNVLEVVEAARPTVEPIPAPERRRFREELFHDGRRTPTATATAALTVPWQTRRRSRQAVVLVVFLLIAGLAALIMVRLDDEANQSVQDSTSPPTNPATTEAATPTTTESAEEVTVDLPVEFAAVLPTQLPDGYHLHWARYSGESPADTVGLARYTAPGEGPELVVFVRPAPDGYDEVLPEGTQTWEVRGRRVIATPDSGPCIAATCGVDVQWNDNTAMSLTWSNWDGTSLDGAVDREQLVDLLAGFKRRPRLWEEGSIDSADASWGVPTASSAPLVLPDNSAEIISTIHAPAWPGSSSVALQAPDGSVITLQEGDGGQVSREPESLVVRGAISYTPPVDSRQIPLAYDLAVVCGFATVADRPGSTVLRPAIRQLFDAMTIDRGEIAINLGPPWTRIAAGDNADVYTITFRTATMSEGAEVTLAQSPDGTRAALMFGRGPFKETNFLGNRAWRERKTGGELRIVSQRAGTAFDVRARGLTLAELEDVVAALQPATLEAWTTSFGVVPDLDIDTSCPQQPFFNISS